MSKINSSDVRKVAQLARLDLPNELIDTYASQIEKILTYIEQLEAIDTEGVTPTARAVEVIYVKRNDEVKPCDFREELLSLAPQRQEDFFRVPQILSDD